MTKKMTVINDKKDIPSFSSLEQESRYWDTHTLSAKLLEEGKRQPPPQVAAILNRKRQGAATTLELTPEVAAAVSAAAEKVGTSPNEYVNEVLKKALKIA